jgi:Fe-S-cluster-containing hydrogenase component 2/CRP-like cAMP-binding protein
MPDFEDFGPFARPEGMFSRDAVGRLVRIEPVTENDLYERIILTIDGKEIAVPLALPSVDELGTPKRDSEGRYIPRQTTLYDAIAIRYHWPTKQDESTLLDHNQQQTKQNEYRIPAPGRTVEPPPTTKCQDPQVKDPVPTLCHQHHVHPVGVCRVCSVMVAKRQETNETVKTVKAEERLVAACISPVTIRMHRSYVYTCESDIRLSVKTILGATTAGEYVTSHVKMLLQLLATNHLHDDDKIAIVDRSNHERNDPIRHRNELLELCERFGVVGPRRADQTILGASETDGRIPLQTCLPHREPRYATAELIQSNPCKVPANDDTSRVVRVDRNDCILCDRCLRACSEVKPFKIIGHTGFGRNAAITFDLNKSMDESECVACGECATACPTGALTFKNRVYTANQVFKPDTSWPGREFEFWPVTVSKSGDYLPPESEDRIDLYTIVLPTQPTPESLLRPETVSVAELTAQASGPVQQNIVKLFDTIPEAFLHWNQGAIGKLSASFGDLRLCTEGENGSVAFILLEGKVDVYQQVPGQGGKSRKTYTWNAEPSHFTILGEMACMTHQKRSATLVAQANSKVWVLRRNLLHVLQRNWQGHNMLADMYRTRTLQNYLTNPNLFRGMDEFISRRCLKLIHNISNQKLSASRLDEEDEETAKQAGAAIRPLAIQVRKWLPLNESDPAVEEEREARNKIQAVIPSLESWEIAHTPPGSTESAIRTLRSMIADPKSPAVIRNLPTDRLNDIENYFRLYNDRNKARRVLQVELLQYRPGEVIIRQGDPPDGFYVLHMGHVRITEVDAASGGKPRIVDYLQSGQPFGELAILTEIFPEIAAEWPNVKPGLRTATITALDHVEAVRIGTEVFRKLVENPDIDQFRKQLEDRCRRLLARNKGIGSESSRKFEQFLTEQGLYQGKNLLVLDLNKCTRCQECVKACADSHGGVTRLILEGNRFEQFLIPSACRSCHDPVCLVGCPVDAIHRKTDPDKKKLAIEIADHCIGCGLCAHNCPFGSIHMVASGDVWEPLRAKLVGKGQKQLATNCDLCESLDGKWRCVHHCPHDAAHRMDGLDLARLVGLTPAAVDGPPRVEPQ